MASQFTDAELFEHVQRYGSKELDWEPFAGLPFPGWWRPGSLSPWSSSWAR